MINLNSTPASGTGSGAEPVWKILVLDRTGQDIVGPLLSVKELRELGVTLHVLIHGERDAIPDVPVIYFVLPSDENIKRICQDFKNQLYDHFYLNFITPISRQKLEALATTAFQTSVTSSVCKVFDQYSHFVSLEEEFFVLREHDRDSISYYAINRGDVKEQEVDGVMNAIVDGLLSVFVTLNVVPLIRCPKGNAAEMLALKLERKLREAVQDTRNSLFVTSSDDLLMPRPRPLLVLLDRNMDMATPLHHTWTYQALAHDVLSLRLNRVVIHESDPVTNGGASGGGRSQKAGSKTYDLSSSDRFWQQHKGKPFPQVAESVQEELDSYRASEDEVKRLKVAMGLENAPDETVTLMSDATAKLNSAVSSLPELIERKKAVDMHTTIATAILDQIKARKLDVYFELEEKILSRSAVDRDLLEFLQDSSAGTLEDKVRLFLIYFLCDAVAPSAAAAATGDELKKFEAALTDAGCDMRPFNYVKRWKTFSKMPTLANTLATSYSGGTRTVNMISKLMSQGSQFVMEGVKNFVVKKHILPFTRITDALMDHKTIQETEDYLFLDPKSRKDAKTVLPPTSMPFQEVSERVSEFACLFVLALCCCACLPPVCECVCGSDHLLTLHSISLPPSLPLSLSRRRRWPQAVVFVVGGGNYIEYQNLMDYCASKSGKGSPRRVIYGCTDLMNADQFLHQLSRLGDRL